MFEFNELTINFMSPVWAAIFGLIMWYLGAPGYIVALAVLIGLCCTG